MGGGGGNGVRVNRTTLRKSERNSVLMPAVFGELSVAAFPFGDVGGDWIRNEERSGVC